MTPTIKIAYLYEDLMNTYGDSGDVKILRYYLNQKGYDVVVDNISLDTPELDTTQYDFLFFGGGQDFEQTVVAKDIHRFYEPIKEWVEQANPMLGVCGGYQFLGTHYQMVNGKTIKCLGILPFHTVFRPEARMIGDTKFETPFGEAIAFENHSGCTYFDDENLKPLGKMSEGYGNNPEDGNEGLLYKNTMGTYAHGPILKNLNITAFFVEKIIDRFNQRTQKNV